MTDDERAELERLRQLVHVPSTAFSGELTVTREDIGHCLLREWLTLGELTEQVSKAFETVGEFYEGDSKDVAQALWGLWGSKTSTERVT